MMHANEKGVHEDDVCYEVTYWYDGQRWKVEVMSFELEKIEVE